MLKLPAHLDHTQAVSLSSWGEAARAAGWKVDASGLEQFDSAALALLLDLRRQATLAGQSLELCDLPQRLRQLATLYGVHDLIA